MTSSDKPTPEAFLKSLQSIERVQDNDQIRSDEAEDRAIADWLVKIARKPKPPREL